MGSLYRLPDIDSKQFCPVTRFTTQPEFCPYKCYANAAVGINTRIGFNRYDLSKSDDVNKVALFFFFLRSSAMIVSRKGDHF